MSGPNFQVDEPPQKQLWREKLRVQVEKRAKRDRERAYERGRSEGASSGASSEVDDDEDGDTLDDEVRLPLSSLALSHTNRFSQKALPASHD